MAARGWHDTIANAVLATRWNANTPSSAQAQLRARLAAEAQELHEMEAVAADARARLRSRAVQLAEDRELDITDIAQATGMSRDTLHRLIRQRETKPGRSPAKPNAAPQSTYRVGQRVLHPYQGEGTIEHVEGQVLSIRFINEPEKVIQLLGAWATLQLADTTEVANGDAE